MNRRRFALSAGALLAAAALSACKDKPDTAAAPPPATPKSPEEVYALAVQGSGFTVGPVMAAHTVYVFFDPACPHCAQLWQQAKPLASRLKMVWIPISLLRNHSGPQGAAILSAANPVEAMEQHEASVLASGPGIAVPASLPEGALDKVKANTALFHQAGAESVPLIVFRNAKSGQHGTHAGAVPTEQLAAMAGV